MLKVRFESLARIKIFILTALIVTACGMGLDEEESLKKAKSYYENRDLGSAMIELKNVLVESPRNAEARYLLGSINLQIGDATSAKKDLKKALDSGWDEAATRLRLAEVLFRNNEFQAVLDDIPIKDEYPDDSKAELLGLWASAEQALGKWKDSEGTIITAETINKDAVWVLQSRIRLHLSRDEVSSALAALDRAITLYPDNQDLWLIKAGIQQREGDLDAVDASLQQVIELDPARIITAWGRQARLGQARIRLLQNEPEKALQSIKPALNQYPMDPDLNYVNAIIAFKQENYDTVRDSLLKVFKVNPEHYASLLLFGNLNYIEKDYQQAAHYLEKATSVRPENTDAQALLGRTYIQLGQYNEAEDRLDFAASNSTNNAELLTLLGISKIMGGDEHAGLQRLEKAAESAPGDFTIRNELAKAYMDTGDIGKAVEMLESALKAEEQIQGKTETSVVLVLAYLRQGEFDQALDLSNEIVTRIPDNPVPYYLQGVAHEGANNFNLARSSYQKSLSLNPDFVISILGEARLDMRDGKLDDARARYRSVLEIDPDNVNAAVLLAYLLVQDGKPEEAVKLLEKARKADPRAIDPRVILSTFKLNAGQVADALALALEANKIAPDHPDVLLALGRAQLATGAAEAESTLLELTKRAPAVADGHYLLAQARASKGDADGTRAALTKVLELNAGHVQARQALGNLELLSGNTDAAMKQAEKLKSIDAGVAAGALLAGDVHMRSRNTLAAIESYEDALESAPASSEAVVRLSRAYRQIGNNEKAYSLLQEWVDKYPDNAGVRYILAVTYLANGKRDKAITEYESILDRQPDNAAVLNDLAWLYYEDNRQGALEMARKANTLAPENPTIMDTYGWILVQTGRTDSGLALLKSAADGLTDSREVRYHLAYALAEAGQKQEAVRILNTILGDDKSFGGRADAQALLDKLKN